MVHYFPLYVFIDIDLFQAENGHLSESFQEICKLLLKNKTCIYGLTTKTLSSSQFDYLSLFTSVHFHDSHNEITKAATIENIIKDDIGEGYSTTIFFGRSELIESFYKYQRNSLAIEFIGQKDVDGSDDVKQTVNKQPDNSPTMDASMLKGRAWLLQDYTILEFVLYYISIHQSIKTKSKYFAI